jgi:hypothetical protein
MKKILLFSIFPNPCKFSLFDDSGEIEFLYFPLFYSLFTIQKLYNNLFENLVYNTPEAKEKMWNYRKEVILKMGRYVALRDGEIKTDVGVVCLKAGDCFTIDEVPREYLEKNYARPLRELLRERYQEFMRVLKEFEMVMDDIKEKNPEFLQQIQNAINMVETHYIKEDYKDLVQAVKNLKALYLQAMRGQY